MAIKQYLDFEIEIEAGATGEYKVSVDSSTAGSVSTRMRFPFGELELERRLQALQLALMRSAGVARQALLQEEQTTQDFGVALYEALFSADVRALYTASKGQAAAQGKWLRLKLNIHPPELNYLPWEYLYDPHQGEYICRSRKTPLVRYIELPQPVTPLEVSPPLRVLGMVASPKDLPPLKVENEKYRLDTALKGLVTRGLVNLEWLPGQTWRDLQAAMLEGPWHVFHFIGHGGFSRERDEGFIGLVGEDGNAVRLYAQELGLLLADHDALRLVFLNACEGGCGGSEDIYSSTASILLRRGIPAVVAMQFPITDRGALEFGRAFYETLAKGQPVDASVAEARKAVSLAVEDTLEWGVPVLYTRSPDGVLFDIAEQPAPAPVVRAPAGAGAAEPVPAPPASKPRAAPVSAPAVESPASPPPDAAKSAKSWFAQPRNIGVIAIIGVVLLGVICMVSQGIYGLLSGETPIASLTTAVVVIATDTFTPTPAPTDTETSPVVVPVADTSTPTDTPPAPTFTCGDLAASNTYNVEIQFGGSNAAWNPEGMWVIGGRSDQRVVALHVTSRDGGQTLSGTMTYSGEGPIDFRATRTAQNTYKVEIQFGGSNTPWNPGGDWILGSRSDQNVVDIKISSDDGGVTLTGEITYAGEGPIDFRAVTNC